MLEVQLVICSVTKILIVYIFMSKCYVTAIKILLFVIKFLRKDTHFLQKILYFEDKWCLQRYSLFSEDIDFVPFIAILYVQSI